MNAALRADLALATVISFYYANRPIATRFIIKYRALKVKRLTCLTSMNVTLIARRATRKVNRANIFRVESATYLVITPLVLSSMPIAVHPWTPIFLVGKYYVNGVNRLFTHFRFQVTTSTNGFLGNDNKRLLPEKCFLRTSYAAHVLRAF